MTLSPTVTSSGTRLPLSSTRPGPTARTSPSWGFSLAVSGMTRPDAVVVSASRAFTTIRSSSGLMGTDTSDLPFRGENCSGCVERTVPAVVAGAGRRGRSRGPRVRRRRRPAVQSRSRLALGQGECQSRAAAPTRRPTCAAASSGPWSAAHPGTRPWKDRRMDAATLSKLLSPEGWALLGALPPYDEQQALVLSAGLRAKGVDPDLAAAAALTQSRLRAAGHAKFGAFADGMLLTQAGLEQATRLVVAARHAQRYLDAGVTKVADLTCGIGADSLAFAGTGLRVLASDVDELTAALATVNLRHFPEAEVRHGDGLALDLLAEGVDGVYADPARRTRAGSRVFDPRAYAPPLDAVWAVRDRVPAVGIKVGPGISHQGLPDDAETEWVSVDGDVVEAALWFGP